MTKKKENKPRDKNGGKTNKVERKANKFLETVNVECSSRRRWQWQRQQQQWRSAERFRTRKETGSDTHCIHTHKSEIANGKPAAVSRQKSLLFVYCRGQKMIDGEKCVCVCTQSECHDFQFSIGTKKEPTDTLSLAHKRHFLLGIIFRPMECTFPDTIISPNNHIFECL